jgi:serine kinase of HPr protein (carbohydrate metabolism regulator)
MIRVHGSCVDVGGIAVLIRGASGRGKSDLTLRLIDQGGRLVADDQVVLEARGDEVIASPPEPIRGVLEVRGLGLVEVESVGQGRLGLVVDLVDGGAVERMPEAVFETIEGARVRVMKLDPFEASAAAKVRLAARAAPRGILSEQ